MLVDLKNSLADGHLLALQVENDIRWQVMENNTYRWLTLNHTVQTVMDKQDTTSLLFPHQQPLVSHLPALPPNPKVLEIGLGGGSQFRFLKQLYPAAKYKVVEPSQIVIELFQQYFNPSNLALHCALEMGQNYLSHTQQTYDLILSDIYSHQSSSMNLLTQDYCQLLIEKLAIKGVVFINLMPETKFEIALLMANFSAKCMKLLYSDKISGYRNHVMLYQKIS
ncbi:hypothetical protein C2869_10260 [Saccharobesus litoralis]|uniref:Spermine synthase n=1 Tax=Saccharobesus litoralis TaxID=2172099 RepID=A0A2S0VRE0_9ALTE|nr:hypothetical protein [Saccharobesus litoralis]AWB66786.1 hypothetical protein C2869_10260 [Saccharobesus litoralis]